MIAIYLGCLLLLLYYFYTKNFNYWQSRGVPFEKPPSILGSFHKVVTRKQHLFHRIREIYEGFDTPYVGIYIFNSPNLIIRSPELIKRILVKDFDKFKNREFAANEKVDPIAAHSIFSAKDQIWRNVRARLSPVFTSGKMKLMLPLMEQCASDLVQYFESRGGCVLDVKDVMQKYAIDIISSCGFGINSYCLKKEDAEVMKVTKRLMDPTSVFRNFSVFCYLFAPRLVDIFRLTLLDKWASDFLTKIFTATVAERKKKQIVRNDLIDILEQIPKEEMNADGYDFDDVKKAAQAITFFSAGNDTTSLTLGFAFYELALNVEIQDRLREEVRDTFQKHGGFTYDAFHEMKYLDMILSETFRKYPVVAFVTRKSAQQYTFEETGLTLDKDVSIKIPISGLHFDPDNFPNPERFDPERFSEANKSQIKPYTYIPFGEGPRNCIGQRFAMLVMKVALAYSLHNFAFERSAETEVPLCFDPEVVFLMNKNGIRLRITKL